MKKGDLFALVCGVVVLSTLTLAIILVRGNFAALLFPPSHALLLISGYAFILWPSGYMIGSILKTVGINTKKEGMEHAGQLIGYLERFLILTFVLSNNYNAVGLLIAAKSILRYPALQENSEYILIGTLLSFSFAVVVGILVR